MVRKYYVQVIADNYLKNVIDVPESIKVHERFLHNLDNEDFKEGFLALLSLTKALYSDIANEPEAFGMPLKENIEYNAKNADYTNSNAGFIRVPNLLLAIGVVGSLNADGSLIINGKELLVTAKELKVTSLPFLLNRFKDYGLETDFNGKTVKEGDLFTVTYPDSRGLTTVLKAMATAQVELNKGKLRMPCHYFYMMHNGILENDKVKEPKLTIDTVLHTLNPDIKKGAALLHDFIIQTSKQAVRMVFFARNDWSCVYTGIKSKKVIMSFSTEQDKLSVKLNLHNIGKYIGIVANYPENIRESIRYGGWSCGRCNEKCGGGIAFSMDGEQYNKCRCGSFVFNDISADSIPYFKELLEQELSC